jgi:predicted SAM-dependent methyltransferase
MRLLERVKSFLRCPRVAAELPHVRHRRDVAARFLRGRGLEVGALHAPLPTPPGCRVTYVDRLPVAGLRRQYPELDGQEFVPVDVVDDGERLEQFAAGSQDFVIANHFLEHAQDPIGTLQAHLRVLAPGGVLYLAVPDRHETFDRHRPPTTWKHLVRDHVEGPAWSYEGHLREYAALVDGCRGRDLEERVRYLRAVDYSIHFHVWDEEEFVDFLEMVREDFGLPGAVEYLGHRTPEILCVIRKLGER